MVKTGELARCLFMAPQTRSTGLWWGQMAGAVQQLDATVTSQPALDGPAGVHADVVEHDRDDRRPGIGVEDLAQELDEGGAVGALGDAVEPAPSGQLDGTEDAALLVLARRHHL